MNGWLVVLIAANPTLSIFGRTVSVGLSSFQLVPLLEIAPTIRFPLYSMRRWLPGTLPTRLGSHPDRIIFDLGSARGGKVGLWNRIQLSVSDLPDLAASLPDDQNQART